MRYLISFLNTDPILEMSVLEQVNVIIVLYIPLHAEELRFVAPCVVTGSQLLYSHK